MALDATSLDTVNHTLGQDPEALVAWALARNGPAIAATNFGPFSAVVLHLVTQVAPRIPVVWVDHGYGTEASYRFADELTRRLDLDLRVYLPRRSRAHREALEGPPPGLDDDRLAAFTREVKLEPFERALRELAPSVWFTGARADQTAERAAMTPVSISENGLIKVAPVFYRSSRQLHEYLKRHDLPNNFDYADPTKIETRRECGLHLAH